MKTNLINLTDESRKIIEELENRVKELKKNKELEKKELEKKEINIEKVKNPSKKALKKAQEIKEVQEGKIEYLRKVSISQKISDKAKIVSNNIKLYAKSKTRKLDYAKNYLKLAVVSVLVVLIISRSYSWFYNEYVSKGTNFSIGNINCKVKQYDSQGNEIEEFGSEVATVINERDISVSTKSSKYIEIKNIGTIDSEYNITFNLDNKDNAAGVMYYRIYDITDEVLKSEISTTQDTKLKSYISKNPLNENVEFDASIPVSNMTAIKNEIVNGTIKIDSVNEDNNSRYYRIDYGMYQSTNSTIYTGKAFSLHTQVYISQIGGFEGTTNSGEIWNVENEQQFRNAASNALPSDTIKLMSDITVEGTVNISRRVNLELNQKKLVITGDLTYSFVEVGELEINTTGSSKIEILGSLNIDTPKTTVKLVGSNEGYDIYVAGEVNFNALQNEEEDGILLDNVRIVKNKVANIPADLTIMSNTRLTIGPDVTVGNVVAYKGATNIEILNNGSIVQVILNEMNLLETFSKPQIYIYNLNVIRGALNSDGIILPTNATPYKSANEGNTLIIKGVNSSDFTISGSDSFKQNDIEYKDITESVIPITGEENSYIVYIRESNDSIQNLLDRYFKEQGYENSSEMIEQIQKIVVYTVNAQYFENEDFDYLKSTAIPNLKELNIENARIKDDNIVGRIKKNALSGKTSLKNVVFPKTLLEIGENAFSNIELGKMTTSSSDFKFLKIPESVVSIETGAFNASKYIYFEGVTPPSISSSAFSTSSIMFVPYTSILDYSNIEGIKINNVHRQASLSDDKSLFVYTTVGGVGISRFVSDLSVGTTLNIPTTTTYLGRNYNINELGVSSFRNISIPSSGVTIHIPTNVRKIDDYAMYSLNIVDINLENITQIGNYSLYNTRITNGNLDKVVKIGNSAFEYSTLKNISLKSIETIGESAFANNLKLYEINLGNIKTLNKKAIYNTPNLGRVYINNADTRILNNEETIDLTVAEDSVFSEWGKYLDGRLRVYVPSGVSTNGNKILDLYKKLFSSNEKYIYETGDIFGSYKHMAIDYDFGEYTVKSIEIENSVGELINGYEIISYQGQDLTSLYTIPDTLTINGITKDVISIGEGAYRNTSAIANTSIDIGNSAILNLSKRSLYGMPLNSVILPSLINIGEEAFVNSKIKIARFASVKQIDKNAFNLVDTLYSITIGNVQKIQEGAFNNNVNLEQIYIENINVDNVEISSNNFVNLGKNTKKRLRIYVKNETKCKEYFKNVFADLSEYVYGKGDIIGSYINAPIQYDIGEYTVREVKLNNISGSLVTGWEIIEYHGADIEEGYEFPTEFTINNKTYNVISIGENAYIHSTYVTGFSADIENNNLINIGEAAFKGSKGINSFKSSSLKTLNKEAFNQSTLRLVEFQNLNYIGELALANMEDLYMINLGKVLTMEKHAVYNLEKLSQVFFEGNSVLLTIDKDSIANVGDKTNGRLRIYVADAVASNGRNYIDIYKELFSSDISKYMYIKGDIIGSYTGPNVPYDIGEYSVSKVQIYNKLGELVEGYEINEYHGDDLRNTYRLPQKIAMNVSKLSATYVITNSWSESNKYIGQYTITIKNESEDEITSWEVVLDKPTGLEIKNYWNFIVTEGNGYYILSDNKNYTSIKPGETVEISFQLSANVANYPLHISSVTESSATQAGDNVISIAKNAFAHTRVETGSSIVLENDNIIEIKEGAFKGLNAIKTAKFTKLEKIGNYAFAGNILEVAEFKNLYELGEYSLANNITLNYLNLGTVKNIKANALSGNNRIAQLVFENKEASSNTEKINMNIASDVFNGINSTISDRFRIYVPSQTIENSTISYVDAYKNTLPQDFSQYIYETGTILGSEVYFPLTYDIGEYSVKEVTYTDYNKNNVTGFEIIEYHGDDIDATYEIPKTLTVNQKTLPVISIGKSAYENVSTLSIDSDNKIIWNTVFSDNIVNISDRAFFGFNIASIAGDRITTIGKNAFENCKYLSIINLPNIVEIKEGAFKGTQSITNINIGNKIEKIGKEALYNSYYGGENGAVGPNTKIVISNMTAPTISENVFPEIKQINGEDKYNFEIEVPTGATGYNVTPWPYEGIIKYVQYTGTFSYEVLNETQGEIRLTSYTGADKDLIIPNTLIVDSKEMKIISIANYAFDNNTTVENLTLPRYLETLDEQFTSKNKVIKNIYVDSQNQIYYSENGVLYSKKSTTGSNNKEILVKYPNGKEETSVSIDNQVKAISTGAFSGNQNIEQITFGNSVNIIASNSFNDCPKLKQIAFTTSEPPYLLGSNIFKIISGFKIKVGSDNLVNIYKNNIYFNTYKNYIEK